MITKISRGFVEMRVGDRSVTIFGEGLLPMAGQPDYVIYKNSIEYWDGPEKDPIDAATRQSILDDLVKEMRERGMKVAVE